MCDYKSVQEDKLEDRVHVIWALAQVMPEEGIQDAEDRIKSYFIENDLIIIPRSKLESVAKCLVFHKEPPPGVPKINLEKLWIEYFNS